MPVFFIFFISVWNTLLYSLMANNYYDGGTSIPNPRTRRITPDPHLPDENALNIKLLKGILGQRNYDFSWMSINTPSKIYEPANVDIPTNKRLDILLSFKNYTLTDDNGQIIEAPSNIIKAIRRWMVQQATCKIDYLWKRLDDSHWPIWIKHGVCNSRESCSWPPGMNCQPNGVRKLKLLKWTCSSDPLGKKWNEYRESFLEEKRKRRSRNRRHNPKKNLAKNMRGINNALRPKHTKRLIKRYLYRTSKYVSGFLCQWKTIEYSVFESCICSCQ